MDGNGDGIARFEMGQVQEPKGQRCTLSETEAEDVCSRSGQSCRRCQGEMGEGQGSREEKTVAFLADATSEDVSAST